MGTRGVIAVPDAAHGFRGRYIHWDSYPTGVGEALRQVVVRDGGPTAMRVLTEEHYGWSSLNPDQDPDEQLGAGMSDGRFVVIGGYGTGYTTEQGQSAEDEWILGDGDNWGTEWAYVVSEAGIEVFERVYGDSGHATGWFGISQADAQWAHRGLVRFTDAEGMARVEQAAMEAAE